MIENGLWCFDNYLLALRRWEKGMMERDIIFPTISLLVQVWGLPFDLMIEAARMEISGGLGKVLQVDDKTFTSDWEHFLRVRVDILLDKPLRRGAPVVSFEGNRAWVAFEYERIVGLCFACGRLGHESKACPNTEHITTSTANIETLYGKWMKAGGCR